ncbi:MAG TPA: tyrosine-protein phosphatase [Candidatus Methylomirabilis sp.]|nr:tyrosine-protein phosphatase [Candidatus Methylomirabilis sp.]
MARAGGWMSRRKGCSWLLILALLVPIRGGLLGGIPVASSPASQELAVREAAAQDPSAAPLALLPVTRRRAERLANLPGRSNVARVAPGIYRGAQPRPEDHATLREMGIRTVINLRARHGERAAIQSAGMRSIEIPIRITKQVDARAVRRAIALMRDPANQPVFVHCAQGKDRTGIVMAVYRMEVDGWSSSETETEMQAFGFNDVWVHLKSLVRRYRPERAGDQGAGVNGEPAGRQCGEGMTACSGKR